MAKKPDQAPAVDHTPKPPRQVQEAMAAAEAIRAGLEGTQQPQDAQQPPEGSQQPPEGPQPPEGHQQPQQQPPVDDQTWEARARSLQGRYDTLQKNYSQQGQRIDEMERLINTLKVKGVEPPSSTPPSPPPKPKFVSEQEASEYGEEFLNVVGKRAREEYFPEFDEMASRLRRLEGRVDGVGTVIEKTQVNDVYSSLNSQIPDWRDINRHPDFLAWLEEPDQFSGRIRKDMLSEAFSGHEARRVVSFFRGFLEAAGLPQNPQASEPTPAPQRKRHHRTAHPGGICGTRQSQIGAAEPAARKARVHQCLDCKVHGGQDRGPVSRAGSRR